MISRFIRWYLKLLWWMIIFLIPFFTLLIPVEPVFDWLKPWDEAVLALKAEKKEGLRWMVGSESSYESINGEVVYYRKKRDFVVLPSVFIEPTVFEYSEGTGIEKGLKIRPYAAFGYLFMYLIMISFSWFVSKPKIKGLFMLYHQKPAE